jgi:hypothetical protein
MDDLLCLMHNDQFQSFNWLIGFPRPLNRRAQFWSHKREHKGCRAAGEEHRPLG